jgi:hypothetical protein
MGRLSLVAILALVSSSSSAREPLSVLRSSDYRRNPAFQPVQLRSLSSPGRVEQLGEVVILEGDDKLVSRDKSGGFGIVFDNKTQNPTEITDRFYQQYGDVFDELVIFTTFDDSGAAGAAAYEISTLQDVAGLGQGKFSDNKSWGSKGKLHAFVNMMKWDQFDDPATPLTDPNNFLYPVLGQEFAHRWLASLRYQDASGKKSLAMLGRDQAHWASTLQANGSLMDGNALLPEADGSYQVTGFMTRFSPLDLYAMGLIPAEEVEPWFLLKNVTDDKNQRVDPTQEIAPDERIKGTSENITIDQVIAAEGARAPSADQSSHDFRIAFVLLTRPGEHAGDVVDIARRIDKIRGVWERQFSVYTNGRGSVCTQVSGACSAAAVARIDSGTVIENGGNGNHVAEPGEPVTVSFNVVNDSGIDARGVSVHATGDVLTGAPDTTLDVLAASSTRQVVFIGRIPADSACGAPITIDATSSIGDSTFRGFVQVIPGLTNAFGESFEAGRHGWVANPDGQDPTVVNGWAFGRPAQYSGLSGWIFQPDGCHGGSSKCWFTGLQAGHRPDRDSSLGVGSSTLYSAPVDLSKTYQPALEYFVWFQAIDFSDPTGGLPASGVSLILESSSDGGKTWAQLDSVDTTSASWQKRSVDLSGIDTSRTFNLRFTANNPSETDLIEAGIDDLQWTTLTAACNPKAAVGSKAEVHGCDFGGSAPTGVLGLLLLAAVLVWRARFSSSMR